MVVATVASCLLISLSAGQEWRSAYESGLSQGKSGNWSDARESFKKATTARPDDQSGPTGFPGPATEQRQWRQGAPYSPNFMAAYAQYRIALAASREDQPPLLRASAAEFEALLAKGQISRETLVFLNQIYSRLNDTEGMKRLESTFAQGGGKINWRVDAEAVLPEDRAQIAQAFRLSGGSMADVNVGASTPTVKAGGTGVPSGTENPIITPPIGRVPVIDSKFALVIGNAESRMTGAALPFAVENTILIRDALINNGGYSEANITVLTNATAGQILDAAKAIAAKATEDSTILIYFAGAGANVDGRDYLAGVDTAIGTDTSKMAAKSDIFKEFIVKGASIFAFFEVNRPVVNEAFFGTEVNVLGKTAQSFGTLRGEQVQSTVRDGKVIGAYADAMALVLQDLKSNRIPVLEFDWQVFYRMRRGAYSSMAGGRGQTPTLPLLSNMGSDARF